VQGAACWRPQPQAEYQPIISLQNKFYQSIFCNFFVMLFVMLLNLHMAKLPPWYFFYLASSYHTSFLLIIKKIFPGIAKIPVCNLCLEFGVVNTDLKKQL
jgi:hypothetical protein